MTTERSCPPPVVDRAVLQKEIDAIPHEPMGGYFEGTADVAALNAKYVALARLDIAFDKVKREVSETIVTDKPAVWFVYNMGTVVKTRKALFSIDLCHPRGHELVPILDFAIITHNHPDHFTKALYDGMDRAHKTVVNNFIDNYGAAFHEGGVGGFTRGERTYALCDTVVRTFQTNHNRHLIGYTMPVEVDCGGWSLVHSGDTHNVQDIHPLRRPDLWVHHAYCCGLLSGIGAVHLKPGLTVVAHLHELHHPKDDARFTFAEGETAKAAVEKVGRRAIVPHWGDRIA